MSKEVQMAFRVEAGLRTRFMEAAQREYRPAAQILRELMRRYVDQSQERSAQRPANDLILAAARRQRESAVNFARASVGLEGFKTTQEDEDHARRFINGEIELAEFMKIPHEPARER